MTAVVAGRYFYQTFFRNCSKVSSGGAADYKTTIANPLI